MKDRYIRFWVDSYEDEILIPEDINNEDELEDYIYQLALERFTYGHDDFDFERAVVD